MITQSLNRENRLHQGTIADGEDDRDDGFMPAIRKGYAGRVYPSRFADRNPAMIHQLAGLARHLVPVRDSRSRVACAHNHHRAGIRNLWKFFRALEDDADVHLTLSNHRSWR